MELGCWGDSESDRAIADDYGKLDVRGCYEKAVSLGYKVFGISNENSNCYTSPSGWKTYKKYGELSCDDERSIAVYETKIGNFRKYTLINTDNIHHHNEVLFNILIFLVIRLKFKN